MNAPSRTSLALALVALLAGGAGGALAFAKPAFDAHGGLAQRQSALVARAAALQMRVAATEHAMRDSAEKPIAYFDLRTSQAPAREMEAKSVETLARLNAIFAQHQVKLDRLTRRAAPAPRAETGPLRLADQRYAFRLRGDYAPLVAALGAIGQLPPAIHLERYAISQGPLGADAPLTLTCELSVTFLLSDAPAKPAAPSASSARLSRASSGTWFDALLGGAAEAAPAATAPAAQARDAHPEHPLTQVQGVRFEGSHLLVETSGGAPIARIVGGHRSLLILELEDALIPAPGKLFPLNQGGITQVRAVLYSNRPITTRLAIDTDGSIALTPQTDAQGRLILVSRPLAQAAGRSAQTTRGEAQAASLAMPAAPIAQATKKPVGASVPSERVKLPAAERAPLANHPLPSATAPAAARPVAEQNRQAPQAAAPTPVRRSLLTATAAPNAQRDNPFQRVSLPAAPQLKSSAPAPRYQLQAVLLGEGEAPLAIIRVHGAPRQVRLGSFLPGGARVTAIEANGVTLLHHRQAVHLTLAR